MALCDRFARFSDSEGKETQRPRRGHRDVELAQRPGGGVARVGEGPLPRRRLGFVEREEIGLGHVDLAAHLDHRRRVGRQPLRHIADSGDVRRHVLADRAVAARRGGDKHAALVAQRQRQPVDLRLGGQR